MHNTTTACDTLIEQYVGCAWYCITHMITVLRCAVQYSSSTAQYFVPIVYSVIRQGFKHTEDRKVLYQTHLSHRVDTNNPQLAHFTIPYAVSLYKLLTIIIYIRGLVGWLLRWSVMSVKVGYY
jgi:hypothetical protein